jgi:translation initiation factor eIF-2B subunit delta
MADAESARPPPGGEASKPRDAVKADREAAKEAKRVAKAAAAAAAAAKKAGVAPKAGQGAGPKEAAGPSQPAAKKQTTQGAAASTKRGAATGERSGPASVAAASSSNPDAAEGSRMQSQSSRTKIPVEPATTSTTTVLGGVSLFGNVSTSTHAKEISMQVVAASYRSQVHPSVLQLAQHLSNFTVVGADARAIAVLKVLRDFVVDYRISSGAVFSRDLVTKLGPQIGFLVNARPLGASVGHAIRYLKYEISVTPVELNEAEVSNLL